MINPPSPSELAWRQRCRDDVVRRGRETGALQDFCTQPVDRFFLPHIAAEDAQDAVDLLVGGYGSAFQHLPRPADPELPA